MAIQRRPLKSDRRDVEKNWYSDPSHRLSSEGAAMRRSGLIVTSTCVLLLLFIVLASVAQARPTRPFPGKGAWPSMVTYYTANNGSDFMRSTKPFRSGVATQNHRRDAVMVRIDNDGQYADSGIVVYSGKLGRLGAFTLKGKGSPFGMNLWFDVDNDGEYFAWDGKILAGLGADTYGLGPSSVDDTLTVDGSSTFFMMTPPYGQPTLNDLKAGAFAGIDSDTHVAIWIGVSGTSSNSATIAPPKSAR
jgi:hypothetical protein